MIKILREDAPKFGQELKILLTEAYKVATQTNPCRLVIKDWNYWTRIAANLLVELRYLTYISKNPGFLEFMKLQKKVKRDMKN